MKVIDAKFYKSVFKKVSLPTGQIPEIAFSGRSNVGKSSLINTLINRKGIAKTSSTPGRTQSINFIDINNYLYFVDLPGYGYAKVSKSERSKFRPLIEQYLLLYFILALRYSHRGRGTFFLQPKKVPKKGRRYAWRPCKRHRGSH